MNFFMQRVEEIYLRIKRDITGLWRGKLMICNQKLRKVFLPLSQVFSCSFNETIDKEISFPQHTTQT
jgi:hypothetical protein